MFCTHLVELPREELNAHDCEDEPEDDADQQHVADGRDGLHQCVDDNLGGQIDSVEG